jgi:threonine aldolase
MAGSARANDIRIDLFSDTKTRPSAAMLAAMAEAATGDEQAMEDPTTLRLEERVAELLGKEAAVFLPSGTMCNQIALQIHCRPGDAVIADKTAHIIGFEGGGAGATAGVNIMPLQGVRGVYTVDQAAEAIPPRANRYAPRVTLIEVEQTANLGGGTVWPIDRIDALGALARDKDCALHMDGARLMNAVAALGEPAARIVQATDSVWIDLSKGLGCPVGAVLAGSKDFIAEAWRVKQRMGGALRQSGYLAAAGLYALDHNLTRLAEDNANAKLFANGISDLTGIELDPATVHSNIVLYHIADEAALDAPAISAALMKKGIRIGAFDKRTMRAVTHLDVSRGQVEEAVDAMRALLQGAA